jgi:uncharacterized protein
MLSSETMHLTPEWPFAPKKDERINGIFFRIALAEKTGRFEKNAAESFLGT